MGTSEAQERLEYEQARGFMRCGGRKPRGARCALVAIEGGRFSFREWRTQGELCHHHGGSYAMRRFWAPLALHTKSYPTGMDKEPRP